MDLCPGDASQMECGRPLKLGEDLCPACQSQKRRAVRSGPYVWVSLATAALVKKLIKSVEESIRNHTANPSRGDKK